MIQLTLQERISERIVVSVVVVSVPQFQEQSVEIVFFVVFTLRSGFSSALVADSRLSRTTGGGRNCGRDSLSIVGWWFAPKSTVLSKFSSSPSRLKISSCVELECGTTLAGLPR